MPAPTIIRYLARMTFYDHWAHTSSVRFLTTQAIYTAWLADTGTGALKTLFDAIAAMTLDSENFRGINNVGVSFAASQPSSESALNSSKLLVEMSDAVNGYAERMLIPGRDPTKYTSAGGLVVMGTGATTEVDTLVTQLEAGTLKSRYGNSVVVRYIKPVGRHLRRQ